MYGSLPFGNRVIRGITTMLLIIIIINPTRGRPLALSSDPEDQDQDQAEEKGWTVPATNYYTNWSRSSSSSEESIRVRRNLKDPEADPFAKDSKDLIHYIAFKEELQSDIFDLRRQDTLLCHVCLWIQPNFAAQYRTMPSLIDGITDILDIMKMLDWIFHALDLNLDAEPDLIGLVTDHVLMQDLNLPLSDFTDNEVPSISTKEFTSNPEGVQYNKRIGLLHPAEAIPFLESQFEGKFPRRCCAVLAFVYHAIPDKLLSFTTLRGACSKHNVGVITGFRQGTGKLGKYDLFRSTFHVLAHLFGADHDPRFDPECEDTTQYGYSNPYVMHPDHFINLGLRSNTMRLSICSKQKMTLFLDSGLVDCLARKKEAYCGNGLVEEGEECDCGAPWQCALGRQCCGSRDSLSPCRLHAAVKGRRMARKCRRPTQW